MIQKDVGTGCKDVGTGCIDRCTTTIYDHGHSDPLTEHYLNNITMYHCIYITHIESAINYDL